MAIVAATLLVGLLLLPAVSAAGPKPCPTGGASNPLTMNRDRSEIASPCPTGPVKFTYLGGSGGEQGAGVAYDAAGNLIVGGWTTSADFPTTSGAYDRIPSAGGDIFIAKLNADATTLIAATLVGGSAYEDVYAMAMDGAGNIYVVGHTQSADFPTTPGTYDNSLAGGEDMFLVKVDPTLSTLLYSTFLGGAGDGVYGLTVDASGNAYLTGDVSSPDFPVTAGAYDTSLGGSNDAFVTKINPAGGGSADLVYSTFLGGETEDVGRSIVVDSSGNAYVAGRTYSADFPTTPGAFDTSYSGMSFDRPDAFVTKLNPSGTGLVYSTFLGGSGDDDAWGIAIDGAGNAYVTGRTWPSTFPTTAGAFDTTFNGKRGNTPPDAYVTKLNAAGSGLVYSTFLGGKEWDSGRTIVVDADGSAYVVGFTDSPAYPVTADGFDTSYNGNRDVFMTRLNAAGSALVYSTFLGGTSGEHALGLAVDSLENVYLTGSTGSTNFPVTSGTYDTSYNGSGDVFAGRMA